MDLITELGTYMLYGSIYFVPLSAIGLYYLVTTYLKPRMMAKLNYLRIFYLTPSGRIKRAFVKPELEAVEEIKDPKTGAMSNSRGYSITVQKQKHLFVDNLDYIFQDGPIRATFYDPEWNQMSMSKFTKLANPLSGRIIDSLMTRVWNAARASVGEKKRNDLILFIVIGAIAAAAAGLAYQNYQETIGMKEMIASILSKLTTGVGK